MEELVRLLCSCVAPAQILSQECRRVKLVMCRSHQVISLHLLLINSQKPQPPKFSSRFLKALQMDGVWEKQPHPRVESLLTAVLSKLFAVVLGRSPGVQAVPCPMASRGRQELQFSPSPLAKSRLRHTPPSPQEWSSFSNLHKGIAGPWIAGDGNSQDCRLEADQPLYDLGWSSGKLHKTCNDALRQSLRPDLTFCRMVVMEGTQCLLDRSRSEDSRAGFKHSLLHFPLFPLKQ
jgi:hypothetical protein